MNNKLKLKKPGLGFIAICVALILSIVAFCLYFKTYKIEPFEQERWTITYTVLAMWCMVFLAVNMLFNGDKPFWTLIIYPAIAFFLIYALLKLMNPCVNAIGFTLGAGDLNMGDVAKNKAITNTSIMTAVFYALSAVFTVAAAFMPAEWTFGRKKKVNVAADAAESADIAATENTEATAPEASMATENADASQPVEIDETSDGESVNTSGESEAVAVDGNEHSAKDQAETAENAEVKKPAMRKTTARKPDENKASTSKRSGAKSAATESAPKKKSTNGRTAK